MARSKSRSNYGWVYSPKKEPSPKIPEALKKLVQERFQEVIDNDLKPNCIHPPSPEGKLMHLADIFGKWYRNYFYICGTYKYKNPLTGEDSSSEHKFSRFEYMGSDRFNVAYMRHTEKFWEFMQDVTLEQCLEALQTLPHLRPF
ncbi:DUF3024 domain-containing protein [Pseudanabaena sp. Chao 1811]|uniref:DUF3024 domain-containing protein n=1 Tax=Pseudanabaena sp. Chao 1811 TaxID=2963092 RepID=UPI0022F3B7AE|nr:hypothetical protein [Pseudanabaena sp. Chao 1811]